jgi:hypothetical protein
MKSEKKKEERLKEGLSLLTQLQKGGVRKNSLSFLDLQQKISTWVSDGTPWDGTVPFPEYGREAIVSLPRYNNKAAGINFKVIREPDEKEDSSE